MSNAEQVTPDEQEAFDLHNATSDQKKAEAERLVTQENLSAREVGKRVGVSNVSVARWIKQYEWVRPGPRQDRIPTDGELDAARSRHEAASLRMKAKWANRKADEADAAGITAGVLRQKVLEAANRGKASEARLLATAYAIFIDKAQLLSGDDTARQTITTRTSEIEEAETIEQLRERNLDAARKLTLVAND